MSSTKSVFLATRPNFLLLSICILLLATALSMHRIDVQQLQSINWVDFWLLFIVFIAAHSAVNLRNEIDDSHSGLDAITHKTPFSGGTGALLASTKALQIAERVFWWLIGLLIITGLYFVVHFSLWLLPLGLIGLVLVYFYTTHITSMPWTCWLAAGFGFGPVMLLGAFVVLTGSMQISLPVLLASLIVLLWVNNLLLLNQLPDIQADRQVGRFNIWMRYGSPIKWLFYSSQLISLVLLAGFAKSLQIAELNWALLWALPMLWMYFSLNKWFESLPQTSVAEMTRKGLPLSEENLLNLRPILAMNVIINLLLPLSLALLLIL